MLLGSIFKLPEIQLHSISSSHSVTWDIVILQFLLRIKKILKVRVTLTSGLVLVFDLLFWLVFLFNFMVPFFKNVTVN